MKTSSDYYDASKVWDKTNDYDAVLKHLRDKGFSKLDSIKALREFCNLSLAEAKRIATQSEVWQDTFVDSQKLHDALFEGAAMQEPRDDDQGVLRRS
jgi:ribosomal protein L7/L12